MLLNTTPIVIVGECSYLYRHKARLVEGELEVPLMQVISGHTTTQNTILLSGVHSCSNI